LTPFGKKYVVLLYPIAKTWGYRTGLQNEHEEFEMETHGFGQPGGFVKNVLQEFTDMLFRNIDEIYYSKSLTKLRGTDTLSKLLSAINLFDFGEKEGPLNKNFKEWAQNLIVKFIEKKEVTELLTNLALNCPQSGGPAVVFLSGVALSLVFISKKDWANAKTTYILLKKLFFL
jgi:hypothetical protein